MPVLKEKKLIFIHIPKTAGSAIESAFGFKSMISQRENFTGPGGRKFADQHIPAKYLMGHKKVKALWDEYIKFSVVRNPYHRVLSRYKQLHRKMDGRFDINHFIAWYDEYYRDIDRDHKVSQYEYLYDENRDVLVDDILKYESLAKELDNFCQKHHLKRPVLKKRRIGWKNTGPQKKWMQDIIQARGQEIEGMFINDFLTFGYRLYH